MTHEPPPSNASRQLKTSPLLEQETELAAHRWLGQFQPLLEPLERLDADDCRRLLAGLPELRADGQRTLARLEENGVSGELPVTVRQALDQLPALEQELRKRLALLAPGDPEGVVDLAQLRTKLAEAAARREVETLVPAMDDPTRLVVDLGRGNAAGALSMGVFAFGWLSFTAFHAVMMIGWTSRAIGWGTLALLGFYSIFFLAGFFMAWTAIRSACREELSLTHEDAILQRTFLLFRWREQLRLRSGSYVYLAEPAARQSGSAALELALSGADGKELRFGASLPSTDQERHLARINGFLGVENPQPRIPNHARPGRHA